MTQVRKTTKNFVLINGGKLGTTCARVGCMPSKILIQIADDIHRRKVLDKKGLFQSRNSVLGIERALLHVRKLRDEFVSGIIEDLIQPLGDDFIEGYAEFIAPTLLKVGEMEIQAEKIIIAAGSRTLIPDHWQRFEDRILTTDTIFEQRCLPRKMAVIGLGPVGLELGLALSHLGLNVTGFDALQRIGGLQDPEVNRAAIEILSHDFPMHLGTEVDMEEHGDRLKIRFDGGSTLVDKVLVSVGRISNIDSLHLKRGGVELDDHGMPRFNIRSMKIIDHPIFIAGDVNDWHPVLHEAAHEGTVAGYNAVHNSAMEFRRRTPMAICFTEPNICSAGATWDEVRESDPAVGTADFKGGREVIMLRDQGLIRIYADRKIGKLLGAEIVAPGGEHLAHLLAWSIQQGLTVFDLLAMPFYHPTIEETLHAALTNLAETIGYRRAARPPGFEVYSGQ
jgi:dihydrolipoamide dehydrogenase